MSNNKIRRYATIVAVAIFFFGYNNAHAATLQIHSNSATVSPGSIATVSVVINSEDVAINNAEAKIIFPTDLLEVVSINKSSSVFSLWVEEPAYSNLTGVITFNGGIPTPGFTGSNGTALSIVVKAKASGQADLIFSDAAVRANDGLGTDVLTSKKGKTIAIVKKEEPVVENISTPTPPPSTISLQVTSPTHASQDVWYKDTNPLFRWKVPTGSDAVQTGIATTTSNSPQVTYSPAINEKSVPDLQDGIWYFKVRARSGGVWGGTSTYIARIDSTVPQMNDVTFSFDDQKKVLSINADIVDETSGLSHYEIYLNDALIQQVPSSEFVDGKYSITVDTPGDTTVKLVAVDYAGNSVESLGTFTVMPVESPPSEPVQPTPVTEQPLQITIGSFSVPALYVAILLLSGVIMLVLGAFGLGRHSSKFRGKHKTRTALSKGDSTKVLLAFKKRLEKHLELLQRTRRNRTLSKEEKDIKEAIEIDLDEVDKAIEDLKVK